MTSSARPLRLAEAAARFGTFCWVERRLFEVTGAWASAPGVADEARLFCFEASAQHAWHAELWAARLPVLAGWDHDALTRPAAPAGRLLERIAPGGWDGDEVTAAHRFVTVLARVALPALLASYRGFSDRLVPVADGPAIRALGLVVRDEEAELARAGELADLLAERHAPAGPAGPPGEWTASLGALLPRHEGELVLLPWWEEGQEPSAGPRAGGT